MSAAEDLKAAAEPGSLADQLPPDVLNVMIKVSQAIHGTRIDLAQAALVAMVSSSAEAFPVSREHALSLADGLDIAARSIRALAATLPESEVIQ